MAEATDDAVARALQAWWRHERADRRLANRLQPRGFDGPRKHLHAALRRAALAELRATERAYVAKLQLLKTHFADPLLAAAAASTAAAPAAADGSSAPEAAAPEPATFPEHLLGAAFAELGRRCSALLSIPPDEDTATSTPSTPLIAAADVAAPPAAAPDAAPPSLRMSARHSSSTLLDGDDEAASAPPLLQHELPPNLSQLGTILRVHDELLARLREAGSSSHLAATLTGDRFLEVVIGCSGPYVQMHAQNSEQLRALQERSAAFARFVSRAEEDMRADKAQRSPYEIPPRDDVSLTSLLMQPVQRVMRYQMMVDAVLKHTPPGHADAADGPTGLPEVLRRIQQLLAVSRQGKMAEDDQRTALRAACGRLDAGRAARPGDGQRLFEPAHRKLLLEFEGERTWLGLCTDRLLVADVDEPGKVGSSLSAHRPDGLPLRGLRVVPARRSGARPGTLTVGGLAAPLRLSLLSKADEASGPFGLTQRDDRVRRWEDMLGDAIRREENRAATIRRTLHAAAAPSAAAPSTAAPSAAAPSALPPALPPSSAPPPHSHSPPRPPPPALLSVPSDLASALAAAASVLEARLGVGSNGRLQPPELIQSSQGGVAAPPPHRPLSAGGPFDGRPRPNAPCGVHDGAFWMPSPSRPPAGGPLVSTADEDAAAAVAAAQAAAAEASWCLVPRLRRVARRWRDVRRARAAASLLTLSCRDWWYQHRTLPDTARTPVSWATLVAAWRGGSVLRVWVPAVNAWLAIADCDGGGGGGTGASDGGEAASPTPLARNSSPATPATPATPAMPEAAAAATAFAAEATPLALRAARRELTRALAFSPVASKWMCTRHWSLVARAHAAAPLGIELEGLAGLAGGATVVSGVQPGGAVHAEGTVRRGDTLVEVHGRRVHSVREAEAALRGAPHAALLLGVSRPWDAAAVGAWLRSLAPPPVHAHASPHPLPSPVAGWDARWERVVQRFEADEIDGPALAAMRQPELVQLCASNAGRPCLGFALRISCALARRSSCSE